MKYILEKILNKTMDNTDQILILKERNKYIYEIQRNHDNIFFSFVK